MYYTCTHRHFATLIIFITVELKQHRHVLHTDFDVHVHVFTCIPQSLGLEACQDYRVSVSDHVNPLLAVAFCLLIVL